jgi:hypothetical protein
MAEIVAVPWHEARPELAHTFDGDDEEIDELVAEQVATPLRVESSRGTSYMLVKFEEKAGGVEAVIMCAAGAGFCQVLPKLMQRAKACGANTMRFHTRRAGVGRLGRRFGFAERERTYGVSLE